MDQNPDRTGTGPGRDLARVALLHARQDARRRRPAWASGRARAWRSRRKRNLEPAPLRVTIVELADERGWAVPAAARLPAQWPALAGQLASGLTAVGFDPATGTLSLRGKSTAWLVQARLMTEGITERVNAALGTETVRALRLLPPAEPDAAAQQPPPAAGEEDPQIQAAIQRQAAQAPREPDHLFTTAQSDPDTQTRQADAVRARALARARSEQDHLS